MKEVLEPVRSAVKVIDDGLYEIEQKYRSEKTEKIRNAVIIGFMANELISIVENAGLMGIPLPAVIANAIDILTQKAEKKGDA